MMQLYTVIFEQDGEEVSTCTLHAQDEQDALDKCLARFRELREYDPHAKVADLSMRVETTEKHM
jgi:hypothetical protein